MLNFLLQYKDFSYLTLFKKLINLVKIKYLDEIYKFINNHLHEPMIINWII